MVDQAGVAPGGAISGSRARGDRRIASTFPGEETQALGSRPRYSLAMGRSAKVIRDHAAELGRRGGLVSSERKAAAARLNGAKGGRPRRKPEAAGSTAGATFVTLTERKRQGQEAYALGVARLRAALSEYARAHGGEFLLFGSAAKGDFHFDSDVDILLRFPAGKEGKAWAFAESSCRALQLTPDIRPDRLCDEAFVKAVSMHAEVLRG